MFKNDYDDLMEFIESADMNDPEQVEMVESCLELMEEGVNDKISKSIVDKDLKSKGDALHSPNAKKDKWAYAAALDDFKDAQETYDERTEKVSKTIAKGEIAAGFALLATATVGVFAFIKKLASKAKSPEVKALEKEANELTEKANELRKNAKEDKMNQSIAKAQAKVIDAKAKALLKKAQRLAEKECKGKECNESADDYDDLMAFIESADMDDPDQVAIVEACLELIQEDKDESDDYYVSASAADEPSTKKIAAGKKLIVAGKIASGVSLASAGIIGVVAVVKKIASKAKSPEAKALINQADELKDQADELRESVSKNILNHVAVNTKIKVLETRAELLLNKAEKIAAAKEDTKEVKESVDVIKTKLEIYESAASGVITTEEKNLLLESLM